MIKLLLWAKNSVGETPTSAVDAYDIVNVVGVDLVETTWKIEPSLFSR